MAYRRRRAARARGRSYGSSRRRRSSRRVYRSVQSRRGRSASRQTLRIVVEQPSSVAPGTAIGPGLMTALPAKKARF